MRVLYYDTGGYDTDFDLTDATTHDWAHLQGRMLRMYDAGIRLIATSLARRGS